MVRGKHCIFNARPPKPGTKTVWLTVQNFMILVGQGDTKRCARIWSRVVSICGVLPCFSFQLLATPQGACRAQKRPDEDAPKIAVHLSNPRGRTWTASDQFSASFAVAKQYHMYVSFIGSRLTKRRLTLINRTQLRTKGQSAGYPQAQIEITFNSFQRRTP